MISYSIEQTAAPAAAPVTLDEAKAAARVLHDDEDALFAIWIDAATALIDGPFGYLGQCIVEQSWLVSFPGGTVSGATPLALPFGPVTDIVSIKTFDGTTLSLDLSADFELTGGRFDAAVQPKSGAVWPALATRHGALQIEFTAGDAVAKANIKWALLMMVSYWHRNRESSEEMALASAIGLLANDRRFL